MKPFKLSLALSLPLALAATAVPASADPVFDRHQAPSGWNQRDDYRGDYRGEYRGDYRGDYGQVNALRMQLGQLGRQVDRGIQLRRLSPREAFGLRSDLRQLDREVGFALHGGLNRFEMRSLQRRIDFLRMKLDRQLHDLDHRGFDGRAPQFQPYR